MVAGKTVALLKTPQPPMLLSEYQQAIARVKELQSLTEGKRWSEKIEALTAWAKIYRDDELAKQARRLKLHAHRRMYELASEFGDRFKAVLVEHGFSEHEIINIRAVGRAKQADFEEGVGRDKPPSPNAFTDAASAPAKSISTITSMRRFVRSVGTERAAEAFREQGCTAEDADELIDWLQQVSGAREGAITNWTLERHALRREHHDTNPEHVKHLRADIAEFRQMLESSWAGAKRV